MNAEIRGTEALERARELMHKLDVCMLTTNASSGELHSRPMSTSGNIEEDGSIWFFTNEDSLKVFEVENFPQVNVSFASKDDSSYVSVTGRAFISRDRAKLEGLWSPSLDAWLPGGPHQPNLALLKVKPIRIEFWDSPGNLIPRSFEHDEEFPAGESHEPGLGEHGIVS